MFFCTDTHVMHESSNIFILNPYTFKECLKIITTKNISACNTIKNIRISHNQKTPKIGNIKEVS